MKTYSALFAIGAFALLGLASCQKAQTENETVGTHTVIFNANMNEGSKTALEVRVVPNWNNTSNDDVHLYENGVAGTNCSINTAAPYEKATFSATFLSGSSPFKYSGVVAQKDGNYFVVPATQTPNATSLLDPEADFLVGISDEYTSSQSSAINMYFKRPVAISRFAITNMEGTKVMSVKITSTDGDLTGKTVYNNIDFANGTASFSDGSKELTISYGEEGIAYTAPLTFYAYFVSLAGTKHISTVEVTTDKWIYTKTINKDSEFTVNSFKNIALDLTVKEGGNVTRKSAYETKYQRVSTVTSGKTYVIVSYTNAKAFDGSKNDGSAVDVTPDSKNVITSSENELDKCEFVITKTGDYYTFKNYENKYLTWSSSDVYYKFSDTIDTNKAYFSLVASESNKFYFKVKDTGKSSQNTEYLYYKNSSSETKWKLGASGAKGKEYAGVYLYEKQ